MVSMISLVWGSDLSGTSLLMGFTDAKEKHGKGISGFPLVSHTSPSQASFYFLYWLRAQPQNPPCLPPLLGSADV